MRPSLHRMGAVAVSCAVGLQLVVGCASYPSKEFPKHALEELQAVSPKASFTFDVHVTVFGRPGSGSRAAGIVEGRVGDVFTKSGLFAPLGVDAGGDRYQFDITVDNHGNIGAAVVTGIFCGLTLTLFPGYARDEYTMRVDVRKGDRDVKSYTYEHAMTTWIWCLWFLISDRGPGPVSQEVVDDMLVRLLYDLQRDGVLISPSAAPGGKPSSAEKGAPPAGEKVGVTGDATGPGPGAGGKR